MLSAVSATLVKLKILEENIGPKTNRVLARRNVRHAVMVPKILRQPLIFIGANQNGLAQKDGLRERMDVIRAEGCLFM